MKNKLFLPIFFLLFLANSNAQERQWQVGNFFSVDQLKLNYTLTDSFEEGIKKQTSLHTSIGFRLEKKWKKRWWIQSGLSISKMTFHPHMYLPRAYGTTFKLDYKEEILFSPLLHQHELHVFSIPLGIKYNFPPHKRWQPFLSLGVNSSMKYHETEIYQEGFDDFNGERKTLEINDPGIHLFNLGFDLETGVQFQVNSFLKIVFAPSIRMIEYRNKNEKFKRNGEFLYETQWLKWTQKRLSVGFLAEF